VIPDSEQPAAPEELAELRRQLDVGLARMEGQLALLTQRDEHNAKEQDDLHTRLTALEHTRWPMPAVAALATAGAFVVGVWQLLRR
jgi:hypothetical protein